MSGRSTRNTLPVLYAVLIGVGFIISTTVGVVVAIVGAVVFGLLWAQLSRGR